MDEFPMNDVPLEIREQIFKYIKLKNMIYCERVSRAWRDHLPYFIYNTIDIAELFRTSFRGKYLARRLSSAAAPVVVEQEEQKAVMKMFLSVLLRLCRNRKGFCLKFKRFCLPDGIRWHEFLRVISQSDCPQLESLCFYGVFQNEIFNLSRLQLFCTHLKSLRLNLSQVEGSLGQFLLMVNQLERLEIDEINMANMHILMPFGGPNLKVLKMRFANDVYLNQVLCNQSAQLSPNITNISVSASLSNILIFCFYFVPLYQNLLKLKIKPLDGEIEWDDCLLAICQNCWQLEKLSLFGGKIDDRTPIVRLFDLQSFKLCGNVSISAGAVWAIFIRCVSLRRIQLITSNELIHNNSWPALLEHLRLDPKLSCASIANLASICSNLRSLDVDLLNHFGNNWLSIDSVVQNCQSLSSLKLQVSGMADQSLAFFRNLTSRPHQLKQVAINWSDNNWNLNFDYLMQILIDRRRYLMNNYFANVRPISIICGCILNLNQPPSRSAAMRENELALCVTMRDQLLGISNHQHRNRAFVYSRDSQHPDCRVVSTCYLINFARVESMIDLKVLGYDF